MGNRSGRNQAGNFANSSYVQNAMQSISVDSSQYQAIEKFDDDQPLVSTYQTPASTETAQVSGNDLTVQVKCCCPQVQVSREKSQEFPCLVSLISPEVAIDRVESQRKGMDLICVIDVSGSMRGQKLDLVKETLNFMLTKLTDKDRVSLVTFEHRAVRMCPLTVCDDVGKAEIGGLVSAMNATGGTNIVLGLHYGLEVIKQRRQRNLITSLFLLSDGQDDNSGAEDRARGEISKYGEETCGGFVTHTFGYGQNHDSNVMNGIAKLRNGSYSFVEKTETVAEAFAQCLGGLVSAFVDSIFVEIQPNTDTPVPVVLGKVYGSEGNNVVKVINMMTGDRKDSVFIISFPQSPENVVSGTKIQPATAVVTYRLINTGEVRRQEVVMDLTLLSETEANVQIDVDETVLVNFYRVKTSEVIREAGDLADRSDNQNAIELVTRFLTEIESCLVRQHPLIGVLINDLQRSKDRMRTETEWKSGGKAMNMDLRMNHMMQQASSNVDVYSNSVQCSYKTASKRKS